MPTRLISEQLQQLAGMVSCEEVPRSEIKQLAVKLARELNRKESPYVSIREAARRWRISHNTLKDKIKRGEVNVSVVAGVERIDLRKYEL